MRNTEEFRGGGFVDVAVPKRQVVDLIPFGRNAVCEVFRQVGTPFGQMMIAE
jgi:hypothetical protein